MQYFGPHSCKMIVSCGSHSVFMYLKKSLRGGKTFSSLLMKIEGDTKKRELLKNPTKIEEIQEKKLLTDIEPLQLAF